MKITKRTYDAAVGVAAGVAAAVLPSLVAAGDISANHATAIGSGIAALVVGYHGGAVTARPVAAKAWAKTVTVMANKLKGETSDDDPHVTVL